MRAVSVVLAAIGIPLALLLLFAPVTWGYGGITVRWVSGATADSTFGRVRNIDPGGASARAGIRVGDKFLLDYGERVTWNSGRAGDSVGIVILRNGARQPAHLVWG